MSPVTRARGWQSITAPVPSLPNLRYAYFCGPLRAWMVACDENCSVLG